MKRYVCVDEPDLHMPAERYRPVYRYELAFSARQTGASSYLSNSTLTPKSDRSPPRAHA